MGRLTGRTESGRAYINSRTENYLIKIYSDHTVDGGDYAAKLAFYEDIIDDPEKLKLIDALYLERCEEINRLNDELEEVKHENEETKKYNLELMEELNELDICYRQRCEKCDSLKLELKRMKEVQE